MSPPTHGGWVPAGKSLGRGLSSLLGDGGKGVGDGTRMLGTDQIEPDPAQPRRQFDDAKLEELASSIREHGVIQPLIVRADGNRFRLVAGERRWRASQLAGLAEVPVVVRDIHAHQVFEVALIENIQRADLNPMEEARGYAQLLARGQKQARVAAIVGKSRSHIANLVRLLDLPDDVQSMVEDGRLSMGHARAILGTDDPQAAADMAVGEALSVRQTEARTRKPAPKRARPTDTKPEASEPDSEMAADLKMLSGHLSETLALPVTIQSAGGSTGTITVSFTSAEDLDRLIGRLSGDG